MLKALIAGLLLSLSPYCLSVVPTGDTEGSNVQVVTVDAITIGGGDQAPYVFTTRCADGGTSKGCAKVHTAHCAGSKVVSRKCVVKTAGDDGEEGDPKVITVYATAGEGDGLANTFVYGGPETVISGGPHVIALSGAGDKTGGWLGVQVGEVPEALVAQFDIEDAGVIVANVVEGSPAEDAGIQRHDVVIAIDGEEITGSVQDAVKSISSREPGEQIKIKVLRAGEEKVITVKLGARADMPQMSWKFKHSPLEEIEEQFNIQTRIMGKGPDGEWVVKDVRDLKDLENLPKSIIEGKPHAGCWSTIRLDGDARSVKVNIQRDGETLVIEREDDGEIVVIRTDAEGNETSTTYESEDALQAGDPDAYETFQEINVGTGVTIDLEGLKGLEGLEALKGLEVLKNMEFDFDDLKGDMAVWRVNVEESMEKAHSAYEDAMKQFEHVLELHMPRGTSAEEGATVDVFVDEPKHSFDVDVDGVIIVHIRNGDSELIRRFKNEDDMAKRNANLYEKYEALRAADDK